VEVKTVVIVGCGGFGREIHDILLATHDGAHLHGFLDDEASSTNLKLVERRGARVLGSVALLSELHAEYLIGIADPVARARIDDFGSRSGRDAGLLIHPTASLGFDVELGPGSVIAAGARLTTNIVLGRHVHLNLNSTVGHDTRIGDYVTVNPGATISGNVSLGNRVTIGTGAAVIQGVNVGAGTTVGAGAVVVRDLPANVTAVGVPAKPLR
jgi:sugar O-acyltransferase (sialic acid O-acetyltransferase NeuD family)